MELNIQEEVYKCSKCGLCQSVCPIYLATKNEMYLSRGRYIVLNNLFNNKKKLSKKFIKNLDLCLNCNACKDFCPSNIDAKEIFTMLKNKYHYKYSFVPFSTKYFFYLFMSSLKQKIKLFNGNKNIKNQTKENIMYFQGCINRFINPADKNATLNILENLGYKVIKISNNCCGLPFLSDGNIPAFEKNSNKILKSIPNDVKYIVCSCDSCYDTLSKIAPIKDKIITLDRLLKENFVNIESSSDCVYHKPLIREEECYLPDNTETINRKGSCSLMENFLMLKYKKLYNLLLNTVFYKRNEIENKNIVTSCLLSKFGIKESIKKIGINANVYSYAEYINLSMRNQTKQDLKK